MPTRAKQDLTPTQVAWAAGFVDGEGYIGIIRTNDPDYGVWRYRVQVDASQAVIEPITLLQSLFGGRICRINNKHRGSWSWRVYGDEARLALETLLPYLVVKKKQAEFVIEFHKTTTTFTGDNKKVGISPEILAHRVELWKIVCELNGGRAVQADRLSEKAPRKIKRGSRYKKFTADELEALKIIQGDAIVESHGNSNHESQEEIPDRLQ